MKPFSLLKRTLAFAIVFFLFSACQPDSDGLSINDAKSFFESTAEAFSLPIIGQLVYDCDSNCSSSPYCPCEGGLH